MPKNDKVALVPEAQAAPAAPVKVSLRNRTRGQLVFNLPHEEYCGSAECACSVVSRLIEEYDFRTKEHVPKMINHRICTSASWLAGETLECDPRVLQVNAIAVAIQRGDLVTV